MTTTVPASTGSGFAHGGPVASGILRARAEDFVVEEIPGQEPSGTGEHLWLLLRQTGVNTAWVADKLARWAGIPPRDVGFAGRKDRHAITTQWFSLRLPGPTRVGEPEIPGVECLEARRHERKLATGALRGNRFSIRVRGVTAIDGDPSTLETRIGERLRQIANLGVPNFFGNQRFGHAGGNLGAAWAWLVEGERRPPRNKRSLYLSAARSECFNRVLAARVDDGSWQRLLPGESVALDGSRSVFVAPDIDEDLAARAAAFDVHPTGPLPGRPRKGIAPGAVCAELETSLLAPMNPLIAALGREGVEAGRRPLRARPLQMTWGWEAGDNCHLEFTLPAGAYATILLGEVFVLQEQVPGPQPETRQDEDEDDATGHEQPREV